MVVAFRAFSISWHAATPAYDNFTWIEVGGLSIDFGFILDPLTGAMLAMITLVGFLIFVYAGRYMRDDPRVARFFCYLSLFAAAMLGLVLSNSLLLTFMCWEIVGLASYLLISFWFHKPSAAAAGKKAFITTRIGDLGFLLGLLWALESTGTLLFYDGGAGLLEATQLASLGDAPGFLAGLSAAGAISLLLFVGAIGKSGQLPLHVWLPDAMEGPTPVSALIHAATMVAAGVFLVARAFPLFEVDPIVLQTVAWVGAATALFAAVVALGQYDLKRILAFSTVSQLGLMMVGLAVGGVAVGIFHLLTHAFFKALLFLGAGSIIHGCGEEQDIRRMGGVTAMRMTTFAYLCGTVALCAVPFTSGYFSKDEILLAAYGKMPAVFWTCAAASLLTAVYMTRQCFYVFAGSFRGKGGETPHESPVQILLPLFALAVFALGFGGYAMANGVLPKFGGIAATVHPTTVVVVSWLVSLGGIALGFLLYGRRRLGGEAPDPLSGTFGKLYGAMENKFYLDELYAGTVCRLWNLVALSAFILEVILSGLKVMAELLYNGVAALFLHGGDQTLIDRLAFDGTCRTL
ncbi:MAG: NADH-quinone oxidoreductase subunit L, partial [Opitutales bacterium]